MNTQDILYRGGTNIDITLDSSEYYDFILANDDRECVFLGKPNNTTLIEPIYEKSFDGHLCQYDGIGLIEYDNTINDSGYTYSGLTLLLNYENFTSHFDTTGHTYSNIILNNDTYTFTGITDETHYFVIDDFYSGATYSIDPQLSGFTENDIISGFTTDIISCVDLLNGFSGTCCTTQQVKSNIPWVAITNTGGGEDNCSEFISRRPPLGWTLDLVFNREGLPWDDVIFFYTGVRDEYDPANFMDNGLGFGFTSDGRIAWYASRYSGFCGESGYEEINYIDSGTTANPLCINGVENDFNITITFERYYEYSGCAISNEGGWNDLIIDETMIETLNQKWISERHKRLGTLKIYFNGRLLQIADNQMDVIPYLRNIPKFKVKNFEEVVLSDRGFQPFTHVVGGGVTGSNDLYNSICCYNIKYAAYFETPMNFIDIRNRYTITKNNFNISECNIPCEDNIHNYTPNIIITPTITQSVSTSQTPSVMTSVTPSISFSRTPSTTPNHNIYGLHGNVSWLGGNRISVTYDWTNNDQLLDWEGLGGSTVSIVNSRARVSDNNDTHVNAMRWVQPMAVSEIITQQVSNTGNHLNFYTNLDSSWNGTPYDPNPSASIILAGTSVHANINGSFDHVDSCILPGTSPYDYTLHITTNYISIESSQDNVIHQYNTSITPSTSGRVALGAYDFVSDWGTLTIIGDIIFPTPSITPSITPTISQSLTPFFIPSVTPTISHTPSTTPPFVPKIEITTFGSVFSPQIETINNPSILWTWADGTTDTSYAPTKNYGSPAIRVCTLLVEPWTGLTGMNFGYAASDGGYGGFPQIPQQSVSNFNNLYLAKDSLRYFLAEGAQITSIDFRGFEKIEFIELFNARQNKTVLLDNHPVLERICVEDNDLDSLNMSGCTALYDLRGALNNYPYPIWPSTPIPIYHICIRDNPQFTRNLPDLATSFPSLKELLIWNTNQTGTFISTGCTGLTECYLQNNHYTDAYLGTGITATYINFGGNNLIESAVDRILSDIDTAGRNNGFLNLAGGTNAYPTAIGEPHIISLRNKGWTVFHNQPPVPTPSVSVTPSIGALIIPDTGTTIYFSTNTSTVSASIEGAFPNASSIEWHFSDLDVIYGSSATHDYGSENTRNHYCYIPSGVTITRFNDGNRGMISIGPMFGPATKDTLTIIYAYLSSGLAYLDILGLEHLTELHLIGTSLTGPSIDKVWNDLYQSTIIDYGIFYCPGGETPASLTAREALLARGWSHQH